MRVAAAATATTPAVRSEALSAPAAAEVAAVVPPWLPFLAFAALLSAPLGCDGDGGGQPAQPDVCTGQGASERSAPDVREEGGRMRRRGEDEEKENEQEIARRRWGGSF